MELKRLLGAFILLEKPSLEEREVGGIIVPGGLGEDLVDGNWLKCHMAGPDCVDVQAGDTVFLPRFSGYDYEYKGKSCLITAEKDVDCKLVD